MSIESDLRRDGIKVIKKLDTLKINSLARNISVKICKTFPDYGLNQDDLFIKLSRLDMYIAKMPEGMAEANYFYKNSSIYFNEHIPESELEEFAVHECIHCIQEVKDKRNYLIRMGLCDYTEFKIYGLGLNEAAVQLMASRINHIPNDSVKYFGINFDTISPSYYPLECCLVSQLAYITGEDALFESTINSNDNFKIKFANLTSPKAFMTIQNSIDEILSYEEEIIRINNKIAKINDRNKKIDNNFKKIDDLKQKITSTFLKTQNLIITSYFDSSFEKISNLEEVETYRKKLYHFKNYIGTTEGYSFFNDYYIQKMDELEVKYNLIENGEFDINSLPSKDLVSNNKILLFFKKLKKLITGNKVSDYENSKKNV